MASTKKISIGEIALTTGGTVNVNTGAVTTPPFAVSDNSLAYRVTGTQTLASNFVISPTGTAEKNIQIKILWEATTTLSGNSVVIFGSDAADSFFDTGGADNKFIATCTYDGSAWSVSFASSGDGTGFIDSKAISSDAITTAKIADDAVTLAKMDDLARGSVIVGGVSDAPTALDGKTSGQIFVGDGTDLASVAVSGDATLASTGAITIANSAITTAKINDGAVTAAKLDSNANKYTRDIAISFETSAQVGVLNFIMCEDCTVDMVSGTVMSPFADDDGTVIFKNNAGTVMTGSQIDFSTSLVLGNQVTNAVTANNSFTAGQKITLELSKTTQTSGKANISLCITKV